MAEPAQTAPRQGQGLAVIQGGAGEGGIVVVIMVSIVDVVVGDIADGVAVA